MSKWTKEYVEEIYGKVMKKAVTNKEFRKKFLANPKAVIKEVSGEDIPDDFKIEIIEANPNAQMTFMLPPLLEESLSDKDLENVAGGACIGEFAPCGGNVCGAAR